METGAHLKKTAILSVGLFIVIFGGLLTIASFFDLQINQLLCDLEAGEYISSNGFGLFFEAIGSSPIYIMSGIACTIWFWATLRKKKMPLAVLCAGLVIFANYIFFSDIFEYVGEHFAAYASRTSGIAVSDDFIDSFYIKTICVLLSAMLSALLIISWGWISPQTNEKLVKWGFVILTALVCYLVVTFIKAPVGRMRYRSMNVTGNWGDFTNWWVINGKRTVEGLPSDSCKSFPSGHTYSAAVIYTLVCLPNILESWNKKWIKIAVWTSTIAFTGIVAVSRLVVGAHFMSDVLVGGTLSFLAIIIAQEFLVYKCAHIKVFKS